MYLNIIRNKLAFSLIELSIVLIRIGLLVAGITGGASLIESAKVRNFMNQLNSYKQGVLSYKVAYDKLPGDTNDDGVIGYCRGSSCPSPNLEPTSTNFGGEYVGKSVAYQAGPWVDLYNANIIDFKPIVGDNLADAKYAYTEIQKNSPKLESSKNTFTNVFFTYANYSSSNTADNEYGTTDGISLSFVYTPVSSGEDKSKVAISPKFMQSADTKMDDGIYNSGALRTCCYGTSGDCENSYQDSINKKKRCDEFIYRILDY